MHERQFVGTVHQNACQSERLTGRQTYPLRRLFIVRPGLEDHPRCGRWSAVARLPELERGRVVHAHPDRFAVEVATYTVEKRGLAAALLPWHMALRIWVTA